MTIPRRSRGRRAHWVSITVIALLVITLAAGCGQPAPELMEPEQIAHAQSGGPDGRILFVANGEISVWDGNVTTVVELDDEADHQTASPSWAPAGDRFAFVEMHEGYSDIIVADQDGDTLKQITTNAPDAEPFSSDYACLAYWAIDPVWSPAGEQIIWVSDREGFEDYFCGDGNSRFSDPMFMWYSEDVTRDQNVFAYQLSSAVGVGASQENPTLSPDGQSAAFTARVDISENLRNTEIWRIELEGGESTVLVSTPDGAFDPAWSPDGENIAYVQRTGNESDIWIAPADGEEPYLLASVGTAVSPTWSPDGRFLAFFRVVDGEIEAAYVEVSDNGGKLTASEPRLLYGAENIDAKSGMSWAQD